jgi:hypothetical protein
MAAITPGQEQLVGVQADDVIKLYAGSRRDVKTATVAEVMHHGYRKLGFAGDAAEDWVGPVAGVISAGDQTVTNGHVISSFGRVEMTGLRPTAI